MAKKHSSATTLPLLQVPEVAAKAQVTKQTAYNWLKNPEFRKRIWPDSGGKPQFVIGSMPVLTPQEAARFQEEADRRRKALNVLRYKR